ncbi:helix-turn-helix domain-containing protein [Amycolatopsis sp. H20-H5]|uniref:helix-turn-helix domain-containing protein n=1 Tax=Amycolatopsis sp. H20-H5 TaxID=3046309 RepID=UPI002DBAA244|nr:helix-turn-helix domain-containing protein [Amycolatopsis sp. H20-H5]MEC3974115.1 helix-turn-helix domain-containing protein [Amycolatopsis sp. H20-H5]
MYTETAAPAGLRSVVRCRWRSVEDAPKRIVPDGCLDLVAGAGEVFVAGPDTAAWTSVAGPGVVQRGLRFVPGQASRVLGVAADELRDERVPLRDLWGRHQEERLLAGAVSLTDLVVEHWDPGAEPDRAVAELLARLHNGAPRVRAAMGQLAVSERQLRRRFTQAVGYGPATYLRVARLQRAIALAPRTPGLASLAAAAGYADQAHLSRDCRELTGLTPRSFFPR